MFLLGQGLKGQGSRSCFAPALASLRARALALKAQGLRLVALASAATATLAGPRGHAKASRQGRAGEPRACALLGHGPLASRVMLRAQGFALALGRPAPLRCASCLRLASCPLVKKFAPSAPCKPALRLCRAHACLCARVALAARLMAMALQGRALAMPRALMAKAMASRPP
ncbi:hypothetical protein CYMTET_33698 [Cymbomonas tetramitiformis]|uniref:Uncharacterized protein n=1 Tax=Cymbomonas tetramitiformis TaxID=36881 RepID=A0AAE0FCL8_9CHLO|nr:hypothetical protein CYMTET_33698 [Cymbomonas tetramitiformis]